MKKELLLFGIISIFALIVMLVPGSITGAAGVQCPKGFTFKSPYCVENECARVKCTKDVNFIKRPDCVCMVFYAKFMCGIRGSAKTGFKTSMCTRRGQLNKLCGSYDSKLGHCVANPNLVIMNS